MGTKSGVAGAGVSETSPISAGIPSRYIHTGEVEEYRPIAEIVEELEALDEETQETSNKLSIVLMQLRA